MEDDFSQALKTFDEACQLLYETRGKACVAENFAREVEVIWWQTEDIWIDTQVWYIEEWLGNRR